MAVKHVRLVKISDIHGYLFLFTFKMTPIFFFCLEKENLFVQGLKCLAVVRRVYMRYVLWAYDCENVKRKFALKIVISLAHLYVIFVFRYQLRRIWIRCTGVRFSVLQFFRINITLSDMKHY